MEKIKLKNIKIFAYHGCMEEEALIGSFYLINLTLKADLLKAGETDDLNHTINYGTLTHLVKQQMGIRSNLLENVAYRIISEIETQFKDKVYSAKVRITKLNPPINADSDGASVSFKKIF